MIRSVLPSHLGLLVACFLISANHRLSAAESGAVEESRQFDHADPRDHHIVSDIRAVLREGEYRTVNIVVSAVGPAVEPPRGGEYLTGSNVITAEEMEDIQREGRLSVVVFHGDEIDIVRVHEGRRGRIRIRRIQPGLPIDFNAVTKREHLLELTASIPVESVGIHQVDWRVDGQPRMRIHIDVESDKAHIKSIESVAPEPYWPHRLGLELAEKLNRLLTSSVLLAEVAAPAESDASIPGVPLEEWKARDLGGRWTLFDRAVAQSPEKARAWVRFLAEQGNFDLLELLAISRKHSYRSLGIGSALAKAQAPQSLRTAIWTLAYQADGHSGNSAQHDILVAHAAETRAWLDRYPQIAKTVPKSLIKALDDMDVQPAEDSNALPPWRKTLCSRCSSRPRNSPNSGIAKRQPAARATSTRSSEPSRR